MNLMNPSLNFNNERLMAILLYIYPFAPHPPHPHTPGSILKQISDDISFHL